MAPETEWDDALDDFLTGVRGNLEENTARFYSKQLGLLRRWCEAEGVDLQQFSARVMRKYVAYRKSAGGLSGEGCADTTRRHDVVCAKQFCQFAAHQKYIPEDPLKDYPLPKVPRSRSKRVRMPDGDQLLDLLRAIKARWDPEQNKGVRCRGKAQQAFYPARDVAIVSLLICTGARIGEVLAIRTEDWSPGKKQWTIPEAKDDEPRTVPLTRDCIKAVDAWIKQRKARIGTLKWWSMKSDLLFINWKGGEIEVDEFAQSRRRYLKWAGLPAISTHSIKHHAATAMFEVDPWMAEQVTGTSIETLKRHYIHNNPEHVRKAHAEADPLGKVLRKTK